MGRLILVSRLRGGRHGFIVIVGNWLARYSIFTFNPPSQVHELAAFRAKGTKWIIFPLRRFPTSWAFHENS